MKLKAFAFFTLVILSCNTSNKVDYRTIQSIEGINKNVVEDFYTKVIDSIISNCHLSNSPITEINLEPLKKYYPNKFENNNTFFQEQVGNFKNMKWNNIIEKEKILTDPGLDSIYSKYWYEEGWDYFQKKLNGDCICSISIPLFTKDFKKVYFDFKTKDQSGGLRRIFEYELKENEWIKVQWN